MMIMNQEKIVRWIVVFFAELLGTATLVFVGCMGCVDNFPNFHPNHLTICIMFGFAVMMALCIFGCVSGSHINPIVTLAGLFYKHVDLITALIYVIGQLCGGFIGYALVRLSILDKYLLNPDGFCLNKPGLDVGRAFVVEFISSFFFILVVCSIWDPRNKSHHDSFPIRFGFVVTVLAFVGGPFGGGSMNPARSFGPALYTWNFENHWIYWVAPLSGALVGILIFRFGFYKEEKHESNITLVRESISGNGIKPEV